MLLLEYYKHQRNILILCMYLVVNIPQYFLTMNCILLLVLLQQMSNFRNNCPTSTQPIWSYSRTGRNSNSLLYFSRMFVQYYKMTVIQLLSCLRHSIEICGVWTICYLWCRWNIHGKKINLKRFLPRNTLFLNFEIRPAEEKGYNTYLIAVYKSKS